MAQKKEIRSDSTYIISQDTTDTKLRLKMVAYVSIIWETTLRRWEERTPKGL